MAEAESLLNVSASASYDRMRNAATARTLLQTLYTETSLFNRNEPPPERYLFILVSMSLKLNHYEQSMNNQKEILLRNTRRSVQYISIEREVIRASIKGDII